MTLIATPGAADATSFVTVGDAGLFLVGHPGEEAFGTAERYLQEAWLMQATRLITRRVAWLDVPANPLGLVPPVVQALPLPMVGQVDALERPLPLDIVPPMAQEATALLALVYVEDVTRYTLQPQGIARLEVHQQVAITYRDPAASGSVPVPVMTRIPLEVWDLLRPYGRVPLMGRHLPVVRGQG